MNIYFKQLAGAFALACLLFAAGFTNPAEAQQGNPPPGSPRAQFEDCLGANGEAGYNECLREFNNNRAGRWGGHMNVFRDGWRNGGYGYHHRSGYRHGHGWFILLILALIIGGIWWWRRNRASPTAKQLLDERFARGEIDEAEYLTRKAALKK